MLFIFNPPVNSSTIQNFNVPRLSRTLSFIFQDSPGPSLFSRSFQGLENGGKNRGLSRKHKNPHTWWWLKSTHLLTRLNINRVKYGAKLPLTGSSLQSSRRMSWASTRDFIMLSYRDSLCSSDVVSASCAALCSMLTSSVRICSFFTWTVRPAHDISDSLADWRSRVFSISSCSINNCDLKYVCM